ncbi:6333_t:CDS:2 [Diversispora eburnea]|uniref:6333_t:CDS:1 n=1 Tax=Diversispora eburnea TaxID=1213867 RepID=A0A9N9CA70_9GLOM|nr:6333_t:CDS:2 [Diversispora eburnea]
MNISVAKLNSDLVHQIAELRKKFAEVEAENIEVKAENIKLKQDLEKYEARFTNLEQKDKEKTDLIAKLDDDIHEIKQSSVNTTFTKMENSNDIPERIELQTENVSSSDISDDTSNSDDTPEQIENISDNTSNSNIQESETQCFTSSISAKTISSEDKEIIEFLES